jgi:tetratricopeptide (TPR) repeat protein
MNDQSIYHLDAALIPFHQGDYLTAREICRNGLEHQVDSGRLWELSGISSWFLGEIDQALVALENASLLVPLLPISQIALASAYAHFDKPDLARLIYRHLQSLPEFPVPLLPQLAAGLGRVGEVEAALTVCEQLVELRPGHHPAWFGIAYYLRRLGRPLTDIIPPLEIAHQLAPHMRTYRLNLSACLAQVDRFEEAYAYVCAIPIEEIRCPHWLQTMLPVFAAVGDENREIECQQLLRELGDGPHPDDWNPDGGCPSCT